ncbi:MAG: hypothetical protein K2J65_10975 [Duncaniella sp.]|nr:hypothetical protein [Duncaniella sp.]
MKTQLTAEQSAKLIELGVGPERASERTPDYTDINNTGKPLERRELLPIFTLADILDILPETHDAKGESARLQMYNHPAGYWIVSYVTYDGGTLTYQSPCSTGKELIDALYSLLVWCLGKGYVKV